MKEIMEALGFSKTAIVVILFLGGLIYYLVVKVIIPQIKKQFEREFKRNETTLKDMADNIETIKQDIKELKETDYKVKKGLKKVLVSQISSRVTFLTERLKEKQIKPTEEEMSYLYNMWNDVEENGDGYQEVKERLDILNQLR